MPSATQVSPDEYAFRTWDAKSQALALELVEQRESSPWTPFYCPNPRCDGNHHIAPKKNERCPSGLIHDWVQASTGNWSCADCKERGTALDGWLFRHAREDQRPPDWSLPWYVWAILSGRGTGKTLTGSRLMKKVSQIEPRSIIIGPTTEAIRETMIEGETGILRHTKPGEVPKWEPSKKKLTWPNGAITQCFSGEEPDRLRGPQSGFIWIDEPAHIALIQECWDNAKLGHRLGKDPKMLCTTTPLPTKWMKALVDDPSTTLTRVSTRQNLRNLAPTYFRNVIQPLLGTTKGRQELDGEILMDIEGSLWKYHMIVKVAEKDLPDMDRILVSVDPAGSVNPRSDETGIIVVGLADGQKYALEDLTGKYSPDGWAQKADSAYRRWHADAIVAEQNFGADMVRSTLEHNSTARVLEVNSRRGKKLRAEPVVADYERGLIEHLEGMNELEDEQCAWIPGRGPSPNRVDALVHGMTELGVGSGPAEVASASDVAQNWRVPTGAPGFRNMRGLGI